MYGVPWSVEDTERLLALHKSGATIAQAMQEFSCNYNRICAKCRQLGIHLRREDNWTEQDIATLERLAALGNTSSQIGESLGRTSRGVEIKAHQLGVAIKTAKQAGVHLKRSYKAWVKEDDNLLKDLFNQKLSVDEMADILGRTPSAVTGRMSKLGLRLRDVQKVIM